MSEQLIPTPGTFGENGNFLLERELGSGGMGGVYMGRDKMLDRPVAVKVMLKELGSDAEFVEKFKKEAQAAAKLIHPNIAQIYSYGISDGMPYMAMELATGGSLYSIMTANPGKTDITRVLKICQQTAQALQCASDQGFVHGDVKPENILLDSNGNAKLVDFGLAAMQKDTDEIWGTPYYISPEKVRKEAVDFRADMYSLGGTLYHALTGVAPFEGEDSIAVVKKRFDGAPKKPSEIRPEITPALDALVMKMLEVNKEDRYPSFEALLDAFHEVLTNGLGKPAGATSSMKRPASGTRRVMTTRTRRMVTKRVPVKTDDEVSEASEADGEETEGEKGKKGKKKSSEEGGEEEESGGNLGLKVVLFLVGGLLAIGAVVGGLIWFKVSSAAADRAAEEAQIQGSHSKAKAAVAETVGKAVAFADEFDEFAKKAIAECEKPTEELYKILPMEISQQLKPQSSKELDDAISATNESAAVAAPAPAPAAAPAVSNAAPAKADAKVAAPATSNAAPAKVDAKAKPATSNAAPAKAAAPTAKKGAKAATPAKKGDKAAAPAKPAAPEKPAEAAPPPEVVVKMHELWERAYSCQASAIRIRQMSRVIVKKGAEASQYAEVTLANAEKLAELSRELVDLLDQMKTGKDVENVKKGISYIKSKGKSTVEQTVKRLRIEKLEKDRAAKAAAAAEAEKARLAKLAEEKKAKIEAETSEIKTKFEAIAAQGCFRQLDWHSAIRQLETTASEFTTPEGQLAAKLQVRKVNDMKKVHDIFIKSMNGMVFKAKGLKGAKVTGVNQREIQLVKADGKAKMKVTWQKFYKNYANNLNELFNRYIVDGRKNAKPALNLKDWADAMTGAALTMQLICGDVNGAVERAQALAQEAVKQFPEYATTAKEIFPDITFAAAEE